MRQLSEKEQDLIATMGVYGIWLIKHGKKLPRDQKCVIDLMNVYGMYYRHPDNPMMGLVMGCVDCVVRDAGWEPVGKDYETALKELVSNAE